MIRETASRRPAESLSSLIGLLVALALGIDGQEFPALVAGIVGQIAALGTWAVERRRRGGIDWSPPGGEPGGSR